MRHTPKYDNHEIKRRIVGEIHKTRDRKILQLYLINGMSLNEIATEMNISFYTVRDVWRRYKNELFPPE